MIKHIYHVGLTVSNLDASVKFYRDIMGLQYQGEIFMEGPETEILFQRKGCKARVAYLNGADDLSMPPVELIQFTDVKSAEHKTDLFETSVSEICFYTDDADKVYKRLVENGVECLSEPQDFDFTKDGFGKSRAFYLRDPDGIILEIMQPAE